ncbi:pyridoxamine 5'-phosphate oxidase family protein [Nocardiopsis sediminis]|uniref:Pyridoxamine 5'-phosphate oxidase family protein n=1 Tax=Nocardiopsis sediminis TaxID=1778267 RepID=A0ABV8FHC5_9ACTN
MTTKTTGWHAFADEAPELAAVVRGRFEATKHHVLATLRADGAPRVSGTEVDFRDDGGLYIGSMPDARKALDLQRDGRFALHANPGDESTVTEHGGDAKISGTAEEITDPDEVESHREPGTPPGPFHLFRLTLTDAVVTSVEGDHLVIRLWRPGAGVTETRRA